jgi:hypothetical protein
MIILLGHHGRGEPVVGSFLNFFILLSHHGLHHARGIPVDDSTAQEIYSTNFLQERGSVRIGTFHLFSFFFLFPEQKNLNSIYL